MKFKTLFSIFMFMSLLAFAMGEDQHVCQNCEDCPIIQSLQNQLDTLREEFEDYKAKQEFDDIIDDVADIADLGTGGIASASKAASDLTQEQEGYFCWDCWEWVIGSHECETESTCDDCGVTYTGSHVDCIYMDTYVTEMYYTPATETCVICEETFTSGTSHTCSTSPNDYTPNCTYCTAGCSMCSIGSSSSSGDYY